MLRLAVLAGVVIAFGLVGGLWFLFNPAPAAQQSVAEAAEQEPEVRVVPANVNDLFDPKLNGKSRDEWRADLASDNHAIQRTAMRVMAVIGPDDPKALDALLAVTERFPGNSTLPKAQAFAAFGPEHTPRFLTALSDPSPAVRRHAVIALKERSIEDAVLEKALLATFESPAMPERGMKPEYYTLEAVRLLLKKPNPVIAEKMKALILGPDASLALVTAQAMWVADPRSAEAVAIIRDSKQLPPDVVSFSLRKFDAAVTAPLIAEKAVGPNNTLAFLASLLPKDPASAVAVPKLVPLAVGPNTATSHNTLQTLAGLGSVAKEAIPELLKAFRSNRTDVFNFVGPLLSIGAEPQELLPRALELFNRQSDMDKAKSIGNLRGFGPEAKDTILKFAKPKFADRMLYYTLPNLMMAVYHHSPDDPDVLPALIQDTAGRGSQYHYLFEQLPKEKVVPALRAELKVGDTKRRVEMAALLLRVSPTDPEAAALLKAHCLDDGGPPNPPGVPRRAYVRGQPLAAFEAAGEPGAAHLADLLTHAEQTVRWHALRSLYKIGTKAKAVAPAVRKALTDADLSVRFLAAQALHQIDPKDKVGVSVLVEMFRPENRDTLNYKPTARASYPATGNGGLSPAQDAADLFFDIDPIAAVKANAYGIAFAKGPPAGAFGK